MRRAINCWVKTKSFDIQNPVGYVYLYAHVRSCVQTSIHAFACVSTNEWYWLHLGDSLYSKSTENSFRILIHLRSLTVTFPYLLFRDHANSSARYLSGLLCANLARLS